jgi:phenylpropionate dioxygenase-like ring-hydroxylating dioxygenase large terminal subunit
MAVAPQTGREDTTSTPRRRLSQFYHPLAQSEEVTDKPQRFTLLGEDIVAFRDSQGQPVAFKDVCIHRGTPLSLGWRDGDNLVCAYHGWTYDRTGQCVRIPALPTNQGIPRKARAIRYQTGEAYGVVWAAIDEPLAPIPSFPHDEWNDPDWRGFLSVVETWHSSAGRILENFCDWAHLPWVHEDLLGTRDRPEVQPHDIWENDLQLGFTIEPDEALAPGDVIGPARHIYTVTLPFTVHLTRQEMDLGRETLSSMSVAPITPKLSKIYVWRNHTHEPEADETFRDFDRTILAQDRHIVESQRPEEIPLDLREEMHVKVPDAFSVIYRRLLREFAEEADEFLSA